MRFARIYRYDPIKDPRARIRLDYDPDFGNAILSDEDMLVEHVDNPDARCIDVLCSMQLTTECVRWLHRVTGELLLEMEKRLP